MKNESKLSEEDEGTLYATGLCLQREKEIAEDGWERI